MHPHLPGDANSRWIVVVAAGTRFDTHPTFPPFPIYYLKELGQPIFIEDSDLSCLDGFPEIAPEYVSGALVGMPTHLVPVVPVIKVSVPHGLGRSDG